MKILHVNNKHRGGGGADAACDGVIRISARRGLEVCELTRHSRDLPAGIRGRSRAFFDGIYSRTAIRDLDRVVRDFQPDIVHVHELYPLISPWVLPRCTALGIPVVMTCYDFRLTCPIATHYTGGRICHRCSPGREYHAVLSNCRGSVPESIAYALRNYVARRFGLFTCHVTKFIVLTEFSRRWICAEAGIVPRRVATIPVAVPAPETGVADPSAGEYVAYAGRFVPEKGVEIITEACRRTKLPLRLAGDSLEHPAIRTGDDIQCVPTGNPEALARFYRGARFLVVASRWDETFATVLSEAKGHGVPVISSAVGAMPDLVQDGVTGLLFESGNVGELAEKMRLLWDDAKLCRRLGAAARKDIQDNLNEDVCFEQLLSVYRGILGEAGAAARCDTASKPETVSERP